MKKNCSLPTFSLLLVVLFTIGCLCLPAPGYCKRNITVVYIGFASDKPFWDDLAGVIKQEAERKGLILVDLTPAVPDAHLQAKLLEQVVRVKIDVLILGADSPVLLTKALDRLEEAEIPVIAVDTMIDHPAISAFVGTDNLQGAVLAGKFIVRKTKARGSVPILGGSPGHPNGDARRDGVSSEVTAAGMPVIFRHAHWNDGKAYELTVGELRKENTISAIFSCWDPGIDTAAFAVQKMNLGRELILVGFDGLPRTIKYIRQGRVTATVAQDAEQMGKQSVELAVRVAQGSPVPTETLIAPHIIDRDFLAKHE